MKKIHFDIVKSSLKLKLSGILAGSLIILLLGLTALVKVNQWYETHKLVFKPPVELTFNKPVTVEKREMIAPVIQIVEELPDLENLTPIEEYICEKWGAYDCKTALAIARAESKINPEAYNINTNNTIDVGIFQINSVHFSKDGCSLKDLVDEYKNVDCAYQIWEASGWHPWVAFTNGAFKENL